MKALIIRNHVSGSSWSPLMIDSILSNLKTSSENVDLRTPLEGEEIPDLTVYDLVVLTGGKYDLLNPQRSPWFETLLGRIQELGSSDSKTKLLGICWGHQATNLALGGKLGLVPAGLQVGVEDMVLTPLGEQFFGQKSIALLKHHKREVVIPAPGFQALAERNEIFISESGRFLTFQGHPESSYEIAKGLRDEDSADKPANDGRLRDIGTPHDGSKIWQDIRKWANIEE